MTIKTETKATHSPAFLSALDSFAKSVVNVSQARSGRMAALAALAIAGRTDPIKLTRDELRTAISKLDKACDVQDTALDFYARIVNTARGVKCDAATFAAGVNASITNSPNSQKSLGAFLRSMRDKAKVMDDGKVTVLDIAHFATESKRAAAKVQAADTTNKAERAANVVNISTAPDVSKVPDNAKGQRAAMAQVYAFNRAGLATQMAALEALNVKHIGASAIKAHNATRTAAVKYQAAIDAVLNLVG